MKKICLLALPLMLPVVALAQNNDEEVFDFGDGAIEGRHWNLSVGPKVGATFSTMSDYDGADLGLGMGTSFSGGVAIDARFGRRSESSAWGSTSWWGLQMEALYTQRKVATDCGDDLSISYFEVPVLAQFYATPRFYIEAGVTMALAMSASPDQLIADNIGIKSGDLKCNDAFPTVGVGVKLKNGFMADARYNIGMSDMASNFPCTMSSFAITVGWMFNVVK